MSFCFSEGRGQEGQCDKIFFMFYMGNVHIDPFPFACVINGEALQLELVLGDWSPDIITELNIDTIFVDTFDNPTI